MSTTRPPSLWTALAHGQCRVAAASPLRPGSRIAVVGALGEAWVRPLVAAGARATAAVVGGPDVAEAELVIDARPDATEARDLDGTPRIVVCAQLPSTGVSRLLRSGVLDILLTPLGTGALIDACHAALTRVTARPFAPAPTAREPPLEGRLGAALARTRLPVLIVGETGTGKSRAARAFHATLTPDAPFVEINAAGLAGHLLTSELFGHERGAFTGADRAKPGLVALADGGTLFLDEIGELTPDAQSQLLSFLDTGAYRPVGGVRALRADVRVICATNRDLPAMIADGRFRDDLYYRLASIVVPMPPLREQRDRIPALVQALASEAAARFGTPVTRFSDDALAALAAAPWPGNVRQLRFYVQRLVAQHPGAVLGQADLDGVDPVGLAPGPAVGLAPGPAPLPSAASVPRAADPGEVRSLAEMERELVERAMRAANGNRTRAAAMLGITPRGLYNKLRRSSVDRAPR